MPNEGSLQQLNLFITLPQASSIGSHQGLRDFLRWIWTNEPLNGNPRWTINGSVEENLTSLRIYTANYASNLTSLFDLQGLISKLFMHVCKERDKVPKKMEISNKEKKYMSVILFLNLFCSFTDATESGKRFQLLTTVHAKRFRLLRVLPVWWSSLIDDLLSRGLLENLNNWVVSRSI